MGEDWFNTFQAFYIYVKKTPFKIISKSKRSVMKDNESWAFTRTRLPFWNLRSSLRVTNDKETSQLLNVFIMVCSWDLITVGFTEKSELENLEMMAEIGLLWTLSSMGRPMCVVRAHSCLQERLEPQLSWCRKLLFAFSQRWRVIISSGYCTRESSLLFLVGFIVIVKGLYASEACDLHNIWAFNVCFSSACWLLSFLHCDLWTFCDFLQG